MRLLILYIIAGICAIIIVIPLFLYNVLGLPTQIKTQEHCEFKLTTDSESVCPDCVIYEDLAKINNTVSNEVYESVLEEGHIKKIETVCVKEKER